MFENDKEKGRCATVEKNLGLKVNAKKSKIAARRY
jgi:hypothetical protein